MINRALRDDAPAVMSSLAVLVRGINVLCITRRKPGELKLPPAMRTFRGGELPMQHVEFYRQRVGKKYRCVVEIVNVAEVVGRVTDVQGAGLFGDVVQRGSRVHVPVQQVRGG
jgi:hypothetical protein